MKKKDYEPLIFRIYLNLIFKILSYFNVECYFCVDFYKMATLDSVDSLEKRIETKVHHLLVEVDGLRARNLELTKKVMLLEQNLSEAQKELQDCRKELSDLTCVKATQVTAEEARQMRNRMLKLEREVEKCISLLNE